MGGKVGWGEAERTTNPVQKTVYFGVKMGYCRDAVDGETPYAVGVLHRLYDGSQNWDHLNLIFPVYFDLMRQFSPISPEGAGEVFLH